MTSILYSVEKKNWSMISYLLIYLGIHIRANSTSAKNMLLKEPIGLRFCTPNQYVITKINYILGIYNVIKLGT